jgi:hypothetical protein
MSMQFYLAVSRQGTFIKLHQVLLGQNFPIPNSHFKAHNCYNRRKHCRNQNDKKKKKRGKKKERKEGSSLNQHTFTPLNKVYLIYLFPAAS